ncbi:DUF342 domain-containing protein [Tepidibacillus infernus]
MDNQLEMEKLSTIIEVTILNSGMLATLTFVYDDRINSPIPSELMKEYLEKHKVIYGLDEQQLSLICAHPLTYIGKTVNIAHGLAPLDGKDARIEWGEFYIQENTGPKELSDGRVDYYSVKRILNVKKGELIAQKIPFTEGEAGRTVSGDLIPAKKGKDVYLKPGKNVVMNQTKDKFYAAIDGQVVVTDQDKINVFPIYEVNGDVDFSVGNIDFVGTVVIRGNVPDGFKIWATGDIRIYGNVEGSKLIAGGDIIIQQGVIGHNKSLIKSKKDVIASFILEGDIHAYEHVYVSQSIMHSNVSAGKQVTCSGTKGLIVGGKIQAGEKISAITIGNQLATSTILEVGMNPELRSELNHLQTEKREIFHSLDKIKKALHLLEKMQRTTNTLPPEKKQLQVELINQQISMERKIKEIMEREKEIESQFNRIERATIEVFKVIYPGVKLVIGKTNKFINQEYKHIKFVQEEGEIIAKLL